MSFEVAKCPYCSVGEIYFDVPTAKRSLTDSRSNTDLSRFVRFISDSNKPGICPHLVYAYYDLESLPTSLPAGHSSVVSGYWLIPQLRGKHEQNVIELLSYHTYPPNGATLSHIIDAQDFEFGWPEPDRKRSKHCVDYQVSGFALFTESVPKFINVLQRLMPVNHR